MIENKKKLQHKFKRNQRILKQFSERYELHLIEKKENKSKKLKQ